jgi:predicted phosphodiesterase
MKLAIVSDIHGNLPALQAVLAEMRREHFDAVLNLGDIVSGPLWPCETADRLMALDWPTIAGNHERQALQAAPGSEDSDAFAAAELGVAQRAWLAGLPAQQRAANGAVLMIHGRPGDDLRGLMETVVPGFGQHGSVGTREATVAEIDQRLADGAQTELKDFQVLVCGHTHVPRVLMHRPGDRLRDGLGDRPLLLVNPGSLGRPAYDHDQPHPHVVETGTPHARWAVIERGAHGWQAQLRLTAYDWDTSAARAESLGFAHWAQQLRTGRSLRSATTGIDDRPGS